MQEQVSSHVYNCRYFCVDDKNVENDLKMLVEQSPV